MFNAFECLHVRVESRVQFLRPTQTSGNARHVLMERHLTSALAHLHRLVVNLLARQDVFVNHAHNFRVVLVELDLDERTLQKWTEDVDQLERKKHLLMMQLIE